jgi:YVTN family beta-propeller protein
MISGKIVSEISVCKSPAGMVIDPVRQALYVANRDSNSVSVIDLSMNKVIMEIAEGGSIFWPCYLVLRGQS